MRNPALLPVDRPPPRRPRAGALALRIAWLALVTVAEVGLGLGLGFLTVYLLLS